MPYLTQSNRDSIDNQGGIDIYEKFKSFPIDEFSGALNYLNYKIVNSYIKKNGKKYFTFSVIIGTLICCVFEIYRKLIVPYEEKKEFENGSIE